MRLRALSALVLVRTGKVSLVGDPGGEWAARPICFLFLLTPRPLELAEVPR